MSKRTEELLDVLKIWLPFMEAEAEASHLIDGFKIKHNALDDLLERTKAAIAKAGTDHD